MSDGKEVAGAGEAGEPARLLNQAEIDSLLGLDDGLGGHR